MRPDTQKKLARIRRIGKLLGGVWWGLIVLTSLLLFVAVVRIVSGHGVAISGFSMTISSNPGVSAFGVTIPFGALTITQRVILALIVALALAVQLKALTHLRRLFDSYSRGRVFTVEAAHEIRQLGITGILWIVPNILWVVACFFLAREEMPTSIHLELG
ncbi:MAG TPA: hypothetical protein VJS43_04570, partial [Candidatus Acidoferrales bacterium]|nr:hypothetical protein [Candidatus Acidoferrales bacterium]